MSNKSQEQGRLLGKAVSGFVLDQLIEVVEGAGLELPAGGSITQQLQQLQAENQEMKTQIEGLLLSSEASDVSGAGGAAVDVTVPSDGGEAGAAVDDSGDIAAPVSGVGTGSVVVMGRLVSIES